MGQIVYAKECLFLVQPVWGSMFSQWFATAEITPGRAVEREFESQLSILLCDLYPALICIPYLTLITFTPDVKKHL